MTSLSRFFHSSLIAISFLLGACTSKPTSTGGASAKTASAIETTSENEPMPAAAPKMNYRFFIKMQCAVDSSSFLAIPVANKAVSWRYGSQTGQAKSDEAGNLDIAFSSDTEETAKFILVKYLARTYKVQLADGPMILPIPQQECLK
ncbi:MAG TPA: hypothetical protein VF412_05915 [Bdellovibrio sp.]